MTQRRNRRKFLLGTVVSDKMNKTRVVLVTRKAKHPNYNKLTKHTKKFKAHDENNSSKTGDQVRIMETRPLSKDKRWVISEIIKGN